ncbi:WD40 repeat-like protein [Suillus weaverae]|nr:WD40 repeat-like protein [Suillus weaverae]
MRKGNSSRNSTQQTHTSNEATAGASSHRPRSRVGRFLQKVKGSVKDGANRLTSRSKDSRNRSPVPPNVDHERASSTPNIEVQVAPSGVEVEAVTQSALQEAQEAAKRIHPLPGPVITVASAGQDAQTKLDVAYNFQDTYLKPLRIFDSVIGGIADVHPYAKMALGVLSCAAKIILAQADRDTAVLKLLDKLCEVYGFITQDEILGQISSMRAILGKISQQTREFAHFIKNYSETSNFWNRLGKNVFSETTDTIQKYSDVFDGLMQNFRDQVACDVAIHVHDIGTHVHDIAIHVHRTEEILDLSGMAYAEGAGLDTRKQCLEGTRTEILSQITEWVNRTGDNVPRVLWLSGPAGKGKSAIAHTIAKWFEDVGGLGSCYTFDRQREADRRHEKIFSTIARDLADRDPEMRRALADTVQVASSLKKTADIIQQWQKLLVEPLGKSSGSTGEPIVIVIDALDESGGVETRRDLLGILAGKHQKSGVPKITDLPDNFRFIVTSRPLGDFNDEFHGVQHIIQMSMDDIPPAVAERDIRAYVSEELEGLGFQDREFAVLAEKADGLFEWARLACGYIKKSHAGLSRMDCYDAVVARDPAERTMLLHSMYDLILTDIMHMDTSTNAQHSQKLRSTALARFRSVMGQILSTAEPLPLASLNAMRSYFPTREDNFDVELVVKSMGSLLSGTTNPDSPIRPLHASFRDFLTDERFGGEFFIDLSKAQHDLAFASLRVMEDGLRFNICDLKSSYMPNSEDSGLRERVQKCIPPHLSYSSRFWTSHVRTAVFDKELAKEVKLLFDHERLFFWLELLALINALSSAVPALSLIPQWLKSHSEFKDVSSTAMDIQRFIQVFGGMILHSTPHLYVSALPFSPANSPLSRQFSARFPNTLRVAFGRDMNWPAVQTVLRHTDSVLSVSFSPDSTRIVTGLADKTVRLWDAATGHPVGEPLRGHTDCVNSVSFSPDGTRIVTGSWDKTVRLWDAATGQAVGEPLRGHTHSVNSVSFSPDGTRIVTGSRDSTVRLWDAATGQPVGEPLRGHTHPVWSASFLPDGARIVTGSEDKTVRLWNAVTGQPVGEPFRGHADSVNSVSFSPDGTRIVSGSRDKTVRLWDAATGQAVGEPLRGHTDSVNSVSFSPDGTRIVTGSNDSTVRLWDASTGQPVGEPLRGHTHSVSSVLFSPDGTRIVTGSRDSTVRLWDAATGHPVGEPLQGHTDSVNSVSFSLDGTRIVTGSWDKTVRLWDAATGQPVGEPLRGHTHSVNSVSFSPDSTRIVTGSRDSTVRLWNAVTGQPVGEPLRGHTHPVSSVSFSPDGTRIVTGSEDKTVRLWDAATGQPVGEPLRGHTDPVWSVSFSPDGTRIVTGSRDSTVRLWDAATGQPVGEPLRGHTDSVNSVSFSPDGTRIVSGSWDKTVRLWDAATGQPVGEPLRGHTGSVESVSFSPDGTRIVTGSWDKTVRLWNTATGQPVGEPLRGHTDSVLSVSVSPDGTRIVTGSNDSTVRLWDAVTRQPSPQPTESNHSAFSDDHHIMHPIESATTMTWNTWNNHLISFSSNSIHAMRNTSELTEGASHDDRNSTPFFLGSDSGWVVGPKSRLLFWVPLASRRLFYSPGCVLVIPRGGPELDLSRMAHGQYWQKCREEP